MLKLTALAGLIRPVTLKFGDVAVEARPLPFADEQAIDALEAIPVPPMRVLRGGSLAEPEPDTNDPAYLAKVSARNMTLRLLTVAAACDYAPETSPAWSLVRDKPAEAARWAGLVKAELGNALTDAHINRAYVQLHKAADVGELAAEAAKNSSPAAG